MCASNKCLAARTPFVRHPANVFEAVLAFMPLRVSFVKRRDDIMRVPIAALARPLTSPRRRGGLATPPDGSYFKRAPEWVHGRLLVTR